MIDMEIDKEKYKMHPRVMEIRFICIFDIFEKEYGYHNALKIFEAICLGFTCDYQKVMGLINNRFEVKRRRKTDKIRWRQEAFFMGYCYDETTYTICKSYLDISPSNVYSAPDLFDVKKYCTEEWLEGLNDNVQLCGISAYRTEVTRFLQAIEGFALTILKWYGRK